MSKRGRKPKPIELHELNGNPSKLDLKKKKLKKIQVDSGLPQPPKHLSKDAKEKWNEIITELQHTGILSKLDSGSLYALCNAYSTMVKAAKVINAPGAELTEETPNGGRQQIQEIGIFNRAANLYRVYMAEFGLSPSSRSRLEYPNDDKPRPPGTNGMDDLLNPAASRLTLKPIIKKQGKNDSDDKRLN